VRADRLVSLVLLLRQRGRLTAATLAAELEVSPRTVLRDIEALSAAGVPVYAERGRRGGFALLPGFRTELTGLNHDEALALMTVGASRGDMSFGLGPALASAVRKVADALPDGHPAATNNSGRRLLLEPGTDLLPRRQPLDDVPTATMVEVRRAVMTGRRLRIHYAAVGQEAKWRTLDPIGMVTSRDRHYLLATRSGKDRTYRLSRVIDVEVLSEQAQRPGDVDLEEAWRQRCAQFLSEDHLVALVRVAPGRREELLDNAVAVRTEQTEDRGWRRLELIFQDLWHAHWALWRLGMNAEALSPPALRASLHDRACAMAAQYRQDPRCERL